MYGELRTALESDAGAKILATPKSLVDRQQVVPRYRLMLLGVKPLAVAASVIVEVVTVNVGVVASVPAVPGC